MVSRLLVTGSRNHRDESLIRAALTLAGRKLGRDTVLVHGAAPGADSIAARIWRRWALPTEPHPADWTGPHGRGAGHARNAKMVALGADLCLAFPLDGSRGTWDCVRRARDAGIPVLPFAPAPERPRVVHCKRERHDVYIGRPSKWGNPYTVGRDGSRADVIARYELWLAGQPELLAALGELAGKTLGCWCAPEPCHGDVLVRLAETPSLAHRLSDS